MTQRDDLGGGAGCKIEAAEELPPRTFGRVLQRLERPLLGVGYVIFRGVTDLLGIGLQLLGEIGKEAAAFIGACALEPVEKLARDGDTRSLAPSGHQGAGQHLDAVLVVCPKQRLGQKRPALFGKRVHHFLQEGDVQEPVLRKGAGVRAAR